MELRADRHRHERRIHREVQREQQFVVVKAIEGERRAQADQRNRRGDGNRDRELRREDDGEARADQERATVVGGVSNKIHHKAATVGRASMNC